MFIDVTFSDIFNVKSQAKSEELANYITVSATPLVLDSDATEIYDNEEIITVPESGSITVEIPFKNKPVDPDSVNLAVSAQPGSPSFTYDYDVYAWGAIVTVTGAGGKFSISASGKKYEEQTPISYVIQDDDSVLEYGKQEYTFPANHLIQTAEIAKSIGDTLLPSYTDIRKDVSIEWPGLPSFELLDPVRLQEFKKSNVDTRDYFFIVRQNIDLAEGLNFSTDLRRA